MAAALVATETVGSVLNGIFGDFWLGATGAILAAAMLYSVGRCGGHSAGKLLQSFESCV